VFPQLIAFKRCILQSTAEFGDAVRVTAMDNDTAITGTLDNYDDPIHLLQPWAYQAMMDHVASGDARLTLANFPAYEAQLARNLVALKPPPPPAGTGPIASPR
jgi:hypothetical protein